MTPQQLEDRIAYISRNNLCEAWNDATNGKDSIPTLYDLIDRHETAMRQLLRDFAEAITPEKRGADEDDTDERFAIELGFSEAIDTIQQNTNKLLGEDNE